jgi:hypothetical protein
VRGVDLFGITNTTLGAPLGLQEKGKVLLVKIDLHMWLAAGDYFLTVGAARSDGMQYDLRNEALQFTVVGTPQLFTTSIVNLEPGFSIEEVRQGEEAGRSSVNVILKRLATYP